MSIGVIAAHGAGYSAEVLADVPALYWRLGDASGTTASDSSGNGRNGSYVGSPTLGATGLLATDADTAVTFNGSSQYASINYASWMDASTALTIEALIKTSMSGIGAILDRDPLSSRVYQFRVNSGKLEFIKIGGTGGIVGATSVATVNDNARHHVAATYDGSNIRLYVDGALDKTVSAAGNLGTSGARFRVGVNNSLNADGSTAFFNGTIDEAAVYNSTLSGARIAAHWAAA